MPSWLVAEPRRFFTRLTIAVALAAGAGVVLKLWSVIGGVFG